MFTTLADITRTFSKTLRNLESFLTRIFFPVHTLNKYLGLLSCVCVISLKSKTSRLRVTSSHPHKNTSRELRLNLNPVIALFLVCHGPCLPSVSDNHFIKIFIKIFCEKH